MYSKYISIICIHVHVHSILKYGVMLYTCTCTLYIDVVFSLVINLKVLRANSSILLDR